jgi:hypothetical protein
MKIKSKSKSREAIMQVKTQKQVMVLQNNRNNRLLTIKIHDLRAIFKRARLIN